MPRAALLRLAVAALVAGAVLPAATAVAAPAEDEAETAPVVVVLDEPAAAVVADELDGEQVGASEVVVEVTPAQAEALAADPRVEAVLERGQGEVSPAIDRATERIGAPTWWADGRDGSGQVIVVVDTGVHDAFGGDSIGGACIAADKHGNGYCGPDGITRSFTPDCTALEVCEPGAHLDAASGSPCPTAPGCHHGSAVAAVAAGHGPSPGVAPGASVYRIRVFNDAGTSADLVDIYLALVHARELVDAGVPVAAVNLSVATDQVYQSPCEDRFSPVGRMTARVVRELAERGVATVVAAGNAGRTNGTAYPACVGGTVTVGATDLADKVAPFSNRGGRVDLYAPGMGQDGVNSGRLTIPSAPGLQSSWRGTSFSAPQVSGGLAILAGELDDRPTPLHRAWFLSAAGPVVPGGGARRMQQAAVGSVLVGGLFVTPATIPTPGSRVAVGDLDGDGHPDVLVHGPGSVEDRILWGSERWDLDVTTHAVNGTYLPLVGQLRGALDSPEDILWYAPGAAADSLWEGNPDRTTTTRPVSINGTYEPHVGDFDGDGWDDILWYAPGPAADAIWYGGLTGFTSVPVSVSGTYRVVVGDFDGQHGDDLLFEPVGDGVRSLWLSEGDRSFRVTKSNATAAANEVRVFDFDGDGSDDLLHHRPPGFTGVSLGGPAVASGGLLHFDIHPLSVSASYLPVVGDFDGDGEGDILWYAPGAPPDSLWLLSGGHSLTGGGARPLTINGTYQPVVADFDGDGADDILWFRPGGDSPIWWSMTG